MTHGPHETEHVRKLGELIKDIETAMLTTALDDGSLRSRPMATQRADFDGQHLWFFTDADSAKVHEVEHDRHVNVAYSDPSKNRFVSVSGTARVVRDKAKIKELWSPGIKAWYPDGPDDPKIALLRIAVDFAEYWDTPSNKMVQLIGFAKALLVGERYDPATNEKIDFGQHAS